MITAVYCKCAYAQSDGTIVPGEPCPIHDFDGPIARKTDPQTSHQAAKAFTDSGKRHGQCLEIFELVRRWPRRTSAELAHISEKFDRYQIARRLPDLERAGLVRKGIARECRVNKTQAHEWEIA